MVVHIPPLLNVAHPWVCVYSSLSRASRRDSTHTVGPRGTRNFAVTAAALRPLVHHSRPPRVDYVRTCSTRPSLVRPPRSLAPCPPSRPALRGERRHLAVKMDASRRLTDGSGPTLSMRGGVTREWRWPVGVLMEDRLVEHCLAVSYTASSCTAATGEAVRGGAPSPRRRVPLQSSSHVTLSNFCSNSSVVIFF